MSLVICSNRQDNYNKLDEDGIEVNMRGNGTSNPASFTNHFSNVFKIEPNSEVAVQSVKIERNSLANITGAKFFSVYLGPQLEVSKEYRDGCVLPICVRVKEGSYGVTDLAHELKKCVADRALDLHPDYNKGTTFAAKWTAAADSGAFTGWYLNTSTFGHQLTTNNYATLDDWIPCGDGGAVGDYTTAVVGAGGGFVANRKITRALATGTMGRYTIGTGTAGGAQPLSLCDGIYAIRPWESVGPTGTAKKPRMYYEIGLSRPVNTDHICPDWLSEKDGALTPGSALREGFFDYKLTWAERTETGKFGLLIEQAIVFEGDGAQRLPGANHGQFCMKEVKYFGVAGATAAGLVNVELNQDNCRDVADLTDGNVYYTRLRFVGKGEEMKLEAFAQSKADQTGAWNDVINSAKSKVLTASETGSGEMVATSFKPINCNCWNLYPKIGMLAKDDFIKIEQWGGRANSGTYPINNVSPGSSYWARQWDEDGGERFGNLWELKNIRNIDVGVLQNGVVETSTYVRKLLNADNECPDYCVAILPQTNQNTRSNFDQLPQEYTSIKGNCAQLLGFPGQTAVLNFNQGIRKNMAGVAKTANAAKWQVFSNEKPVFSTQTAFIRCPTLTHQSLNMAKQLPSKIMYQIPRFSNSGKEYGNLYFEASEKTYLDLHNTNEMNINELQLDIVNTDETYCRDLEGQSTIVLHFRRKR